MGSIKGMRIGVDCGHSATGKDISAQSNIAYEYDMNLEVKNKVIEKLRELGAIVTDCSVVNGGTLGNSLDTRCDISNKAKNHVHLCIHHDAGVSSNGNAVDKVGGAEVEYYSKEGAKLAQCIQNEFVKDGLRDRKIQYRNNLYVLKHCNAIVCLTEFCFIDSISDMKLYNPEKEADAIVQGLLNYIGDTSKLKIATTVIKNKIVNTVKKVIPQAKNPFTQTLKIGDNNEEVKLLQQLLVKRGYSLVVDSDFGEKTKEAVINFQSKNGCISDGIVGNQTQLSLIK